VIFVVIAFIVVPIAELYVIIKIGGAIGVVPTLALLVADALLGSMLLRQQGRAAWVRFNRALAENRLPHKEVVDGVLIIFGGALLLTPGFITDVFGLVLLIPPTRAVVRRISMRIVRGRMSMEPRAATWTYGRARRRGGGRPAPDGPGQAPGGRPQGGPAPDDPFSWEDPLRPPTRRSGPQPDDIEGTGQEIRDEDELPPGREPFGG
jgi:UPF0716 protein FxsA